MKFLVVLQDQMGDPIMRILFIAGIVSIIVSWLASDPDLNRPWNWYEGASIIAAVVMIILFTTLNDLAKCRQFQKLDEAIKEQQIPVLRG